MSTHCIYRIVCTVNGKVYVGQSIHPKKRKREHFEALRRGDHPNIHLQNAYNKHGESRFYFEVIEKDILSEAIDEREVCWISYYNSFKNGYNRSEGGDKPIALTTPTTWNGITYPSLKEASAANGLSRSMLARWIRRGYICDSDVPKTNHTNLPRECVWNGIQYPSIKAAAETNGIDPSAMQSRLDRGFTSDNDMKGTKRPCEWNGVRYKSITDAALALGIRLDTLQRRFERGQTCDADMKGGGSNKVKQIVWNGISYPSIRAAAAAIGIGEDAMSMRIKKGYTCDDDLKSNHSKRAY